MRRTVILGVVIGIGALAPGAAAEPSPRAPGATATTAPVSELERAVVLEARRLGHPGVAVGVVVGDKLVVARGFGIRDKWRGGAVTSETVFRIASITKVFAGLALLQLRDEGKLSLDDAITKLLPEATPVSTVPITLRHLVTHTSGLPRDAPSGGIREPELLARLRGIHLDNAPGTHTSYSNLAMGLVGPIVARASGSPFRDYMRSHVFQPLGMNDVAWEAAQVDRAKLATGHKKVKEGERDRTSEAPPRRGHSGNEIEPTYDEWRMGAAEAFGGLYASVDDMAKLVSFELSAWSTAPEAHADVLKRASLQESQTLAITGPPEAQRYGVNWWLSDDPTYGPRIHHTGATDEYSASVMMLPKRGVGVIVLSNFADPWNVEAMAKRLLAKAAEANP